MSGQKKLVCGLLAIVVVAISSQTVHGQWRTRYVRRDGLFHVEKYRTGNGITPAFAGVLTTAVTNAPAIINSVQGRDLDDGNQDRSRDINEEWRERYAEQQRRANILLDRTANLVGYKPPSTSPGDDEPPKDHAPDAPSEDRGTPTNEQESGKNPWRPFD